MRKILIYIFAFSFFINSSYAGIKFWTTEVQPERMEKQKSMAKAFEAKTGISVEVIEKDLEQELPQQQQQESSRM